MPRIDPLSLLKCLSVLLGSTGGIKSKEEVHRLANLMTKFSKKLVSKCIYIQILKTTDTDLLSQFMGAGGWNLVHMWLTDGILAKNWALIQELLELLLLCPVDIERLKSNNCPKLIKGLSKEGSHQGVKTLASRLVDEWLKIVKGEAPPNSVPARIIAQITPSSGAFKTCPISPAIVHQRPSSVNSTSQIINSSCSTSSTSNNNNSSNNSISEKNETDKNTQLVAQNNCCLVVNETQDNEQLDTSDDSHYHRINELPVDVNKQIQCQQQKKQSFVVVPTSQTSMVVPVYKITIRDGKQVLTKVETDTSSGVINLPSSDINGDIGAEAVDFNNSQDVDLSGSKTNEELPVSNSSSSINASEVAALINCKDSLETDNIDGKIKDSKDVKQSVIGNDTSKSVNDKENRDSSKKDEKKISSSVNNSSGITTTSSTTDKKSHHSSSSSKSSSKHSSSSSHRSSSNSHRSSSSSHRSNSKSTSSKDKTKEKDKHHNSSSSSSSQSSSKHGSNSKSRSERDKEKEREKLKKDQAEKDKATLEKVQGPVLTSKLGKIPKKKTDDDGTTKRSSIDSKDSKDKDTKKTISVSAEKKNISISIENRKSTQELLTRPKTVKTFNSKFRSTGLEEEAKPPPPRSVKKQNSVIDKQKLLPAKVSSLKRSSPLRESGSSSDKKARLSIENSVTSSSNEEKKGGIKLIPPKPKPMILQESDMFMDALTAASTKNKEPRKRKRRTSISKEGSSGPDAKKLDTSNSSDTNRDTSPPLVSPSVPKNEEKALVKPNFKFYQDTLEIDEEKDDTKVKAKSEGVNSKTKSENGEEEPEDERDEEEDEDDEEDDDDDDEHKNSKNNKEPVNQEDDEEEEERGATPTPTDEGFGDKGTDSNQDTSESSQNEIRYVEGLRSVLLLQKRKGPKKSLKWKVDLESIRYFELDETERVNVTKTFTDMKQIDKQNEREAFQMARKLSTEDLMEEKTMWRPLIPIDVPPALVEPGKDSREKDIQYAREKGILQALYFHRNMIPDTPAEADEERLLPVVEARTIPLDDLTGTKANEKDFTTFPWPEPKPQLANPQTPPVQMTNFPYQPYPTNNQHPMLPPMGPPQQAPMGPIPPMQQPMMNPMNQMGPDMVSVPPGGGWRTGDGKVVVPDMPGMNPMGNVPGGYPPGMDGQMVPPPGMMGPPMYNQPDAFMMGPDDMGYNNVPNNFQGPPPGPVIFGPGPGPNFQGPRGGGPPMHVNRGRGGPPGAGWFRGGPPVRGVGWRGGWRGNAKQPPVCRQFSKSGYCRAENKCQFLHPGVNCPPF